MNTIENIIWLIFGGFFTALGYFVGGFLLCLTIIGIPFGLQCFKLGVLMLWPFGQRVVSDTRDTGCLTLAMNLLRILFSGRWVAIGGLPLLLLES